MSVDYLSDRLLAIQPSPSVAANTLVSELRAQGRDIVNFTVGEPDFDTPAHIQKAAFEAIQSGETHYTDTRGTLALRKAILTKLSRDNSLDYALDEVIVGSGGKPLIFHALAATLNPHDEVLVHAPYWVSYPDLARLNDAQPVIIPGDEATGFKLTAQTLEASITSKTKWLILNSPNNPSGAVYSRDELFALADVLRKYPHVLIMSDEIYEHFIYGNAQHLSIVSVAPDLKSRTLIINGASKGYAMTGWRIGFAAGPSDMIKAIGKLISQTTTCPSSVSQAAAVAAFEGDQTPLKEMHAIYVQRREAMLAALSEANGITCAAPDGAFYVFANVSGLIGKKTPQGQIITSDSDFTRYLLTEGGVATVSGEAYGMSPYIRLSFASAIEVIGEGCRRIVEACNKLV